MFQTPPTPEVLHQLAQGRLADRLMRVVRLWSLLHLLYGESSHTRPLPQPFRYADVRDRLFASTHGRSDNDTTTELSADCHFTCRCQQSLRTLLEQSPLPYPVSQWQQATVKLTDLSHAQLTNILQQRPFATVHRSIRADLTYLAERGWLKKENQGYFYTVSPQRWPEILGQQVTSVNHLANNTFCKLLVSQAWEVLRSLESISFVQPNLEVIIQTLWEQLTTTARKSSEPERRIFIHLDYILSDAIQEQVDTLQEQIEQFWRNGSNGVVHFNYSYKSTAQKAKPVSITVYPVCLHYARRAKYLSAYGTDPSGALGWHNYRLDRITSPQLKLFDWKHPQVPQPLQRLHANQTLPTSETVSAALAEAWGFNFYLPRKLLIMRFPSAFAERYVYQTDRHATFKPIAYKKLPALIKKEMKDPIAQADVLKTLKQKDAGDQYYKAWIRLGDINIVMRLRDWRPNGEVIAPLSLRQQMYKEAKEELNHYRA